MKQSVVFGVIRRKLNGSFCAVKRGNSVSEVHICDRVEIIPSAVTLRSGHLRQCGERFVISAVAYVIDRCAAFRPLLRLLIRAAKASVTAILTVASGLTV